MSTAELVMNQRIVWDSTNKKEVEEAKQTFLRMKRLGHLFVRELDDETRVPVQYFRPAFEEIICLAQITARHAMMILCDKGDERIVWDRDNYQEAKEAKARFMECVKKGYTMYSVDEHEKKHKQITEFDVDAERVIAVPSTSRG